LCGLMRSEQTVCESFRDKDDVYEQSLTKRCRKPIWDPVLYGKSPSTSEEGHQIQTVFVHWYPSIIIYVR
jgi:hypothetical protein